MPPAYPSRACGSAGPIGGAGRVRSCGRWGNRRVGRARAFGARNRGAGARTRRLLCWRRRELQWDGFDQALRGVSGVTNVFIGPKLVANGHHRRAHRQRHRRTLRFLERRLGVGRGGASGRHVCFQPALVPRPQLHGCPVGRIRYAASFSNTSGRHLPPRPPADHDASSRPHPEPHVLRAGTPSPSPIRPEPRGY
jgi:hypothetical protein